jgi:hypothetical protein
VDFAAPLGLVLDHLCQQCVAGKPVHRFDAVQAPPIKIQDYLVRLKTYFACSNEALVLSLIYLDRVVKLHPDFAISKRSIHRLALTTLLVAVKFFDDLWYSNAHYARAGGVTLRELNQLETELLRLLRWNLHVSPVEYQEYLDSVLRATAEAVGELELEDKDKGPDAAEAETVAPSSPARSDATSDALSEASEPMDVD